MKFAPLLAEYLYIHKRLDLPGIGSFLLDPSTVVEADLSKQNKPSILEGVSFDNNSSIKQSVGLVEFLSEQTGKIKPLAAADLESHLELAKQFLNIGKAFMFEGIGSLAKVQTGGFQFSPGELIAERVKESGTKKANAGTAEEPVTDYRSVFYAKKPTVNWRKPVALLLLLAGVIFAVWGGYLMYKKNTRQSNQAVKNNEAETVLVTDTTAKINEIKDTISNTTTSPTQPSTSAGNYKFILEASPAKRAFARLKTLTNYKWPVQIATRDSITFNLYISLPASLSDTSRIIDSLSRLNGRRVYIGE